MMMMMMIIMIMMIVIQSLYVTLCNSVHGAPWHGPSIKIFSKALREEETCLLEFIAGDMCLPYDLQE